MAAMRCWLLGAACLVAVAWAHRPEEDFGFESVPGEELLEELPAHTASTPVPVQRRWGVPDSTAYVGKLFRLTVAQDAFTGDIDHYEAIGKGGGPLPSWLLFHKATGLFEGVPTSRDVGENYVTVRAVGPHSQDWAKDVFSIDVLVTEEHLASAAKPLNAVQHMVICAPGEDSTLLKIVMDVKYEHLKPKQRVAAIKNLSGFLALPYSLFQLVPQNAHEDVLLGDGVITAGPGNVRKASNKRSSVVEWRVGCAGRLSKPHSSLAVQLKRQARDGTIAEVVGQPIVGWHVETRSSTGHRERRETGSGDYDYVEYDEEDEEDLDNEEDVTESIPEQRIVPTMVSPVFPEATAVHPHRHHHGEGSEGGLEITSTATYRLPTSPLLYGTIISTPTLIPIRPTRLTSSDMLEPSRAYNEYAEITPSATPVFITEVEPSITPEMPTDHFTEPLPTWSPGVNSPTDGNETEESSFGGTNHSSTFGSTNSSPPPTSEEPTTLPPTTTERKPSTRPNEEVVIVDVKNIQPHVDHRLPRKSITAGKALRFVIPENTFSDLEDGNTKNLRLIFKTSEGRSVPPTSWVQFNPETQEVYALPLEENVSRWVYVLEAMDREGAAVSDNLELLVQHHKGRRTVNHEFSLHLRIESKFDFPSSVDWQLRVLDGLARLYDDPDPGQITVRNVSALGTDPVVFSWTNDSLPRTNCPTGEINRLLRVLQDPAGEPSAALIQALAPELRVKKIAYRGLGQCETANPPPVPPVRTPNENFPPVTRNQVDHIDATVGELLVFRVPDDSFYDPEDGDTRHLRLSLLNMDRTPIAPGHWLQFDVKNQEFYGVPMGDDRGRREYQLVCEDSAKQRAYDGLVVVVRPAPPLQYNVEFAMRLDVAYESFAHSAASKRRFVDKLRELFGDRNTSAIALSGLRPGSTVVTWHNRSLPTQGCPDADIVRLRRVLLREDETVAEAVRQTLGPEFPVLSVGLTPVGACQGRLTLLHPPPAPEDPRPPPSDEYLPGSSDEYLLTFVVPAVIIAAMLVLAGVVACFLYRRRRSGKMSPGEDDERQAFRSKGIPVIFQDELEERPDPENKSPVIMKEEKPPLPPPEYRREDTPPPTAAHPLLGEEDPPYQPPPPFSRDPASRQTRPKPTPTYRKPPPYVPP